MNRLRIAHGGLRNKNRIGNRQSCVAILAALVAIFAIGAFLSSCSQESSGIGKKGLADAVRLLRFYAAGAGQTAGTFDPHFRVVRRGEPRDCLLLIGPMIIRADLNGAAGEYVLEALGTQVFNTGDGIQMDVYLSTGDERTKLYSRYFDAGRRAEDRDWIPISIPLILARPDSHIDIVSSAGPQGDLGSDWLALASPRLVLQKGPR